MNRNSIKTKAMRFLPLLLLTGVSFSNISCERYKKEDYLSKLFFTIKGKDLEITFCDIAASVYSIKYKGQYITYHPKDYKTFLTPGYWYGKTLGRITGRIKDGKLNVKDKIYQVEINETGGEGNKNNSIHGGFNGLTTRPFKHYIYENNENIQVSFNYVSPHLEAGYPETLDTWVVYTVHKNEDKFDINITATSTGITPVNITTHPFFRLGNSGDVKNHLLKIPANEMAKYEFNGNKTNHIVVDKRPITGTPFDFSQENGKPIGQDVEKAKEEDPVSGGYDHIWIFKDENSRYIELTNPDNKLKLRMDTDADAIIMYSNCYPHKDDEMNPSGKDALYSGISVEPYKFFTKDTVSDLNITPNNPFKRNISYTVSQTD